MTFTIKNCRVEITFLFLATLTFSLLIDRTGIAGVGVIATILHECGHLLMMHYFKVPPSRIKLNPFGIDIVEGKGKRSYAQDVWISLAGPLSNLIFFLIFYGWSCFFPNLYTYTLSIVNLTLALFNCLPIEPLDGGQALYSSLCRMFGAERSGRFVEIISFFILLPLAAVGFLVLFQSRYNFSLLLVTGYLLFLLVLKKGRYF